MKTFYQFLEMVVQQRKFPDEGATYHLEDYAKQITSSGRINSVGGCGHDLEPLNWDEMGTTSAEDAVEEYMKLHKGKSPTRLGQPMTDEEFQRHHGIG